MATPEQQMAALAKQMGEMAIQMGTLVSSSTENSQNTKKLAERQQQIQEQLDRQQEQINQNSVLTAGTPLAMAKQGDWMIPQEQFITGTGDDLVSQRDCAAMIQKALTEKVAPILSATVGTVVQTCEHMDSA